MVDQNDESEQSANSINIRDKIIYGLLIVLMAFLSFISGNMYARLGVVELLLREMVTSGIAQQGRFVEDHALLMNILQSRDQRTIEIADLKERMKRIESNIFHMP